jgi:predicted porin
MKRGFAFAACCALSAVFANAARAADGDPVTLYGFVNADVESVKATGSGGGIPQYTRVSNNLTVLGFRGTENLGGGLKAMFQLETSFPVDTPPAFFGGRDSGMGLITPGGTVIAGMWMTPFKYGTNFLVDPFANNTIAGINGIMGNGFALGGNATATSSFDRRQLNSLQYWSPALAGFSARLMYGANEEKAAGRNPQMWSGLVAYSAGPVYAAFACERHDDYFATGTRDQACRAAGIYTIGGLRLRGSYERLRYEPSVSTHVQRNAWMLGATYEAGPHVVRVSYVNALASTGDAKAAVGGIGAPGGDTSAKQMTLSYGYAFSKRTEVYVFYVRIDNGGNAIYNLPTNPLAGLAAGQDPQGYGIGMKVLF